MGGTKTSFSLAVALLLASGAIALVIAGSNPGVARADPKPNILFVMTDDQPESTMLAMPEVRGRIRDAGMTLSNAYVSQSLCCPSRASILRGQYPHNTGVMRNGPPRGGVQSFRSGGKEGDTVAHWLRRQGYTTALVGKYMNGYNASYKPPGWSYWYAKADAGTRGKKVNSNGRVNNLAGEGGNWGDRFRDRALRFLDSNTDRRSDKPFALFFWSSQPHLQAGDYADRYARLYRGARLPKPPSFDEADVSDKPRWVRELGRIDARERDRLRQWRRNQLRSVRQIDDAVGAMLDLLKRRGELDNTYVVFTTDNDTHMGEHRWVDRHGAKDTAYEEAANVLMYVRGPGIAARSTSDRLVSNNDLAPTFVSIAGGSPPDFVDGRSLLPVWRAEGGPWRTAVMNESPLGARPVPPYHALVTQRYTYVEYGTGERELYDRALDPYELRSRHDDAAFAGTAATLSARLGDLKGCGADSCRRAENGPLER